MAEYLRDGVWLDPPVGDQDHALGPATAPVTLVKYGDYECPYCGRMHPVVRELRERLGDRLRFVFRHFPLDSVHPHARRAAEAAEAAAAQGRFWEMHDLLYENRENLDDESLGRYADELGLDVARFEDDLSERRHAPRVREDRFGGERSGVEGTPTFFVNGMRYEGSLELQALLAAVEDAASDRAVARSTNRLADPLDEVCSERRGVNTRTLRRVVQIAVEIAREGREGRKIGTLFVVGDSEEVIRHSRPLILDPLAGHPHEKKRLDDPDTRETLKELAQLDGAFIVSDEGVVLSAARYLDAVSDNLDVPLGLGSRHVAAASISKQTAAVAVAVSESSVVRMFDDGELVSEIIPEIWMLGGYGSNGSLGRGIEMTVRSFED
ncbi:MAG TPA: thioredoxin domain-containing protein [Rubrobacteraceae bacterium]|nr:thioredoxin domain-containing protein [Rubrobacteraceae bacterium]